MLYYAANWNRYIYKNSFQGTAHFKMTREQNLSSIPNHLKAGTTTQAANPTGSNRTSEALPRPSITLKSDDVWHALESQLPPWKKDMKLLCKII